MALVHEFGIIDTFSAASFEDYSPEKYQCISVNDAHIQALLQSLSLIKTYFIRWIVPSLGWLIMARPSFLPNHSLHF